jgi:hypothetical protein
MEPKERLKEFVEINNGHACDDNMFYEIVFETIENRLEESDFHEVMNDENFNRYFPRYEDLISFAKYMQERNN